MTDDTSFPTSPPETPRRWSSKRLVWTFVLGLFLLAGLGYLGREFFHSGHDHAESDKGAVMYTCPMHPSIIQDRPGQCPICGMDLVKIETPQPSQTKPQAPPVAAAKEDDLEDLFSRFPRFPVGGGRQTDHSLLPQPHGPGHYLAHPGQG